jgi:hypothetical protein
LLVELAYSGILLRVTGQACPYTLPRDVVSRILYPLGGGREVAS